MKCEGFSQISDLVDYLENNRLIAYYCGFNIMKPLPSYWTYARFLRQVNNSELKEIMAALVRKLYDEGIVDASFIGLDSTPISANTRYNNPKSFAKNKFSKKNPPKRDRDCALGVHSASNQHNERRYEFYWGYKSHVLVDCISGLPLYELTTPANTPDSNVAAEILANANQTISLQNCSFIADKGYDARSIYNTVKDVYDGEAFIPLKNYSTKNSKKLASGNPICEAGLAMHKDGKTTDNGRTRQKYCCPFRQSKTGQCPCNHRNWNNGKKNRGCTKYPEPDNSGGSSWYIGNTFFLYSPNIANITYAHKLSTYIGSFYPYIITSKKRFVLFCHSGLFFVPIGKTPTEKALTRCVGLKVPNRLTVISAPSEKISFNLISYDGNRYL